MKLLFNIGQVYIMLMSVAPNRNRLTTTRSSLYTDIDYTQMVPAITNRNFKLLSVMDVLVWKSKLNFKKL